MNNNILSSIVLAGSLSVASTGALAEDTRICTQSFGYDPSTQTYQAIAISCENIASILDMHPGFTIHATFKKGPNKGFTQIDSKDGYPILGIQEQWHGPRAKKKG